MAIGDFYEIFSTDEKWVGRPANIHKSFLKHFMDSFGAVDIISNGPKFTWTNKRNNSMSTRKKLDRAIASSDCFLNHPIAMVLNKTFTTFDHRAFILDLFKENSSLSKTI